MSDNELLGIIARTTASRAGQQAAARIPELVGKVAENPHLHADIWDDLAGRHGTRATVDRLKLLMLHPRTPDQIDWLMDDPRASVGAWLAHTQPLTLTQLETLQDRWPHDSGVGWAVGKDTNATPQLLERITSIPDAQMLQILGARSDSAEHIARLLLRATRIALAQQIRVSELLHANPATVAILLDALGDPTVHQWTADAQAQIAVELSESAHLPGNGWETLAHAHGGPDTRAVVGAYGNPNTDPDGISWCEQYLHAHVNPSSALGRRVTEITRLRADGLVPVTGAWTGDLPADQRNTVAALSLAGLAREQDWHIRTPQRTPKLTRRQKVKVKTSSVGLLPAAPDLDDWPSMAQWRTAVAAKGGKWADRALRDDPDAWDTFIVLAQDWTGTLADLATTSLAVGSGQEQSPSVPQATAHVARPIARPAAATQPDAVRRAT